MAAPAPDVPARRASSRPGARGAARHSSRRQERSTVMAKKKTTTEDAEKFPASARTAGRAHSRSLVRRGDRVEHAPRPTWTSEVKKLLRRNRICTKDAATLLADVRALADRERRKAAKELRARARRAPGASAEGAQGRGSRPRRRGPLGPGRPQHPEPGRGGRPHAQGRRAVEEDRRAIAARSSHVEKSPEGSPHAAEERAGWPSSARAAG